MGDPLAEHHRLLPGRAHRQRAGPNPRIVVLQPGQPCCARGPAELADPSGQLLRLALPHHAELAGRPGSSAAEERQRAAVAGVDEGLDLPAHQARLHALALRRRGEEVEPAPSPRGEGDLPAGGGDPVVTHLGPKVNDAARVEKAQELAAGRQRLARQEPHRRPAGLTWPPDGVDVEGRSRGDGRQLFGTRAARPEDRELPLRHEAERAAGSEPV